MRNDVVDMARLAQHDERMSTGALYGDLADRIEELEAKLAQQDDLVQAANRLAEYLNGDYIYMERVHHLAALVRKGGE